MKTVPPVTVFTVQTGKIVKGMYGLCIQLLSLTFYYTIVTNETYLCLYICMLHVRLHTYAPGMHVQPS